MKLLQLTTTLERALVEVILTPTKRLPLKAGPAPLKANPYDFSEKNVPVLLIAKQSSLLLQTNTFRSPYSLIFSDPESTVDLVSAVEAPIPMFTHIPSLTGLRGFGANKKVSPLGRSTGVGANVAPVPKSKVTSHSITVHASASFLEAGRTAFLCQVFLLSLREDVSRP